MNLATCIIQPGLCVYCVVRSETFFLKTKQEQIGLIDSVSEDRLNIDRAPVPFTKKDWYCQGDLHLVHLHCSHKSGTLADAF